MVTIRLVAVNLNKDFAGDAEFLAALREQAGPDAVFVLQESGHGLDSTVIRGPRKLIKHLSRIVVGKIGVHRGVARSVVFIDGKKVKVFSVHGLHKRTSGEAAQKRYYKILARRIARLNKRGKLWIIGTDANYSLVALARELGGKAHGEGIIGFIVSPGLTVTHMAVTTIGMDHKPEKWTDHPEVTIDAELSPTKS